MERRNNFRAVEALVTQVGAAVAEATQAGMVEVEATQAGGAAAAAGVADPAARDCLVRPEVQARLAPHRVARPDPATIDSAMSPPEC